MGECFESLSMNGKSTAILGLPFVLSAVEGLRQDFPQSVSRELGAAWRYWFFENHVDVHRFVGRDEAALVFVAAIVRRLELVPNHVATSVGATLVDGRGDDFA